MFYFFHVPLSVLNLNAHYKKFKINFVFVVEIIGDGIDPLNLQKLFKILLRRNYLEKLCNYGKLCQSHSTRT